MRKNNARVIHRPSKVNVRKEYAEHGPTFIHYFFISRCYRQQHQLSIGSGCVELRSNISRLH